MKRGDSNVVMFTVADAKPGDSGSADVALVNAGSIDGFLDITFSNLVDDDISCTDPEDDVDATCGSGQDGELDDELDIVACLDSNSDGDCSDPADEAIYTGAVSGIIGEQLSDFVMAATDSVTFRIEWDIDTAVTNVIQSDKAGFDITFELA